MTGVDSLERQATNNAVEKRVLIRAATKLSGIWRYPAAPILENNMGRFLTPKDLHEAKREQEIWNSMLKRGEIDPSKFVRTEYVVCGCGVEGCGFITTWKKDYPNVVDLEEQQRLYQEWLAFHKV